MQALNQSYQDVNISGSSRVQMGNIYNQAAPERAETPPAPFSTIPFQRDSDFVRRGSLSKDIQLKLDVPGARVALVGLGGIGKTQLAIDYARTKRAETPGLWVLWLYAGNAERLDHGVRGLLEDLKVAGRQDQSANHYQLLRNWLRDPRKGPWLVIIDNADDALHLLRPTPSSADNSGDTRYGYIPICDHGSVIITTRSRSTALKLVHKDSIVTVDPMDLDDAVSFMHKKLGDQEPCDDAVRLVKALDLMPLAMAQAAAYISHRAPRCSAQQYLAKMDQSLQSKFNVMNTDESNIHRDREASNSILKTWQISFEHISEVRPSAADLLGRMSFYDRQAIPEILLEAKRPLLISDNLPPQQHAGMPPTNSSSEASHFPNREIHQSGRRQVDSSDVRDLNSIDHATLDSQACIHDRDSLEDDIQMLRDYSFISVKANMNAFEMHALVQLATQKWLETTGHAELIINQALMNLNDLFPSKNMGGLEFSTAVFSILLPHAMATLRLEIVDRRVLRAHGRFLYSSANSCTHLQLYASAHMLLLRSLETFNILKREHSSSALACRSSLAVVYLKQGQSKRSEEIQARVLDALNRTRGSDDNITLKSMYNLAAVYRRQGQYAEAESLLMAVIDTRRRLKGEDDQTTFSGLRSLAWTQLRQGRLHAAEELSRQIIDTHERLHGTEHDSKLGAMRVLAEVYLLQGRLSEAQDLYLGIWNTCNRILGGDHTLTLQALFRLAKTYRQPQQLLKIEEQILHTMKIRERARGVEHPDILRDKSKLGMIYAQQGRLDDASATVATALGAANRVLSEEDFLIGELSRVLGLVYSLQGRLEEAKELREKALKIFERSLGERNEDTLKIMVNLSQTLHELKHFQSAANLMDRCATLSVESFGPSHPDTTDRQKRSKRYQALAAEGSTSTSGSGSASASRLMERLAPPRSISTPGSGSAKASRWFKFWRVVRASW